MTLEEAKKILEEEGFKLGGPGKPGVISEAFAEYESPEICEAMQIVCSAGFQLAMLAGVIDERKERLKKEYEKNTKAPCPVEEQPKENGLKAATDAFILQANEIMRLKKKNAELLEAIDKMKEGNPALEESASQFNEALLDEQAKDIKRLGKEISKLNGIIHDKNAILSDVAEELRLTKIREKNLVEVSQKYMKEVEAQKDLADDIRLKYDGAKYNLKLECEELKKQLDSNNKLIAAVRNASKEYCDYGVAANEFIKELAHLYVLASNNGIINIEMLERCKNYQTYGFPANCNRETKKEINDIARGKKNKKPSIPTPEEPKYDSIIERCKRLGIELHYHDGKVPTYTNAFGDEVPVYGLRGIFAICTDEEYKSLFKK